MRVLLVSSHSANNQNVFELSTDNHREYSERHGYTYRPVEEPYNPYTNVDLIRQGLEEFDVVLNIGCDCIIQQAMTPVSALVHTGLTIGRELRSDTLNADVIIWDRSALSMLKDIERHQHKYHTGQDYINKMYKDWSPLITVDPYLQIAAPRMNLTQNYRGVCINRYWVLHYHTIGYSPVPRAKANAMKLDACLKVNQG